MMQTVYSTLIQTTMHTVSSKTMQTVYSSPLTKYLWVGLRNCVVLLLVLVLDTQKLVTETMTMQQAEYLPRIQTGFTAVDCCPRHCPSDLCVGCVE